MQVLDSNGWEVSGGMTTVCLHVKPTAFDPGLALMSVTLIGPRWTGDRLSLRSPEGLGLPHDDLVGWSDFYGGGPCPVHVAFASNGRETGYLIWGGTLGLRSVPASVQEVSRDFGDVLESRAVLWVDDPSMLPAEVRQAVEVTVQDVRVHGSSAQGDRLPASAEEPRAQELLVGS